METLDLQNLRLKLCDRGQEYQPSKLQKTHYKIGISVDTSVDGY